MVLIEDNEGVRTITLSRPDSLNALTYDMLGQLTDVLHATARDESVACVVVTGAGRGFCSGADIAANAQAYTQDAQRPLPERQFPQSLEADVAEIERWAAGVRQLRDMPKPTIAMVNGPCAGAGMGIAGACDLRYAAASAMFTTAFAKIGVSGDLGGAWYWTQIVGSARARELYLLSERISAATALDWGMANGVLPDDALVPHVQELARNLASRRGSAHRYIKANLNAAETESLDAVLKLESSHMVLSSRRWTRKERRG